MISIFDLMHDERRYGWVVDSRYQWIKLLTKMEQSNPQRFEEFKYSKATIYHHIDRLNQEQNTYD